jgi:hypothetical protein
MNSTDTENKNNIRTEERTDVLIWWTDQEECETIGYELDPTFPTYLCREYRSRHGRNGRGRLWAAGEFRIMSIPWDETKPAAKLADKRGGIVIWKTDAPLVFNLPGFLTDMKLNFINELDVEKEV